jgi:ketosteroid isomerase-like protein
MAGTESGTTVNNTQASDATTKEEIRAVLDRYVKSVNEADEAILREFWVRADDASYVNPMQRLRSWGEVQGFWQGFLKGRFTRRELKPDNVVINVAGDVAWRYSTGSSTRYKPTASRCNRAAGKPTCTEGRIEGGG